MSTIVRALVGAALSSLFGLTAAAPTAASTLSESALAGGFSSRHDAPTTVSSFVSRIEGTGAANAPDIFSIEGLTSGTILLDFAAPEGIGYSYSAGGVIMWREGPFRWGWDGERLSPAIQLDKAHPEAHFSLALPEGFSGPLSLALWFTHGADIGYAVTLPRAVFSAPVSGATLPVAVAAVPLPSALPLMGAALAGLGLLGRRRKRA